jgi:molecular chaperone DnaJ
MGFTLRIIKITIPKDIKTNDTLKFDSMGHAVKNGINGNLIVKIFVDNHENFTRDGDDLKSNLKLKYTQLILGNKVEIPTIDGSKIRINIPKNLTENQEIEINKLKNLGF